MCQKTFFTALRLIISLLVIVNLSGCTGLQEWMQPVKSIEPYLNPLKTMNDVRIEKLLIGDSWRYQQQEGDCKNTHWIQEFHSSQYYKSTGSSCLQEDSFSFNAESWHIKDRTLYIVNLSPREGEDIVLKYGIALVTPKRLVLTSGNFRYPFVRTSVATSDRTSETQAATTEKEPAR